MEAEAKSSPKSFSISEAVGYGWEVTKKNLAFLIITAIIIVGIFIGIQIVSSVFQQAQGTGRDYNYAVGSISLAFSIAGSIINMMVTIGYIRILLKLLDGQKPEYSYIWNNWNRKLWNYFLGSMLYSLIVIAGFILLIIPGIIFALKYQFYMYLIIDKDMGPVEAIKESSRITKGNLLNLFVLGLVEIGLMLLGFALFLIGALFTYPVAMLAHAYVYRKLVGGKVSTPKAVAEVAVS